MSDKDNKLKDEIKKVVGQINKVDPSLVSLMAQSDPNVAAALKLSTEDDARKGLKTLQGFVDGKSGFKHKTETREIRSTNNRTIVVKTDTSL